MISFSQTAPLDSQGGLSQVFNLGSFNGYAGVNNPAAPATEAGNAPATDNTKIFWIIIVILGFLIYGTRG